MINQPCDDPQMKRDVDSVICSPCTSDDKQRQKNIEQNRIIPFTYEELKELQHQDEQVKHIITHIEDHKEYFIRDGMFMKQNEMNVIPTNYKSSMNNMNHHNGDTTMIQSMNHYQMSCFFSFSLFVPLSLRALPLFLFGMLSIIFFLSFIMCADTHLIVEGRLLQVSRSHPLFFLVSFIFPGRMM